RFRESEAASPASRVSGFMIPINKAHIRQTLKSWKVHYNSGRPHSSRAPEFRIRDHQKQSFNHSGIAFRRLAEWWRHPFLAVYIKNTAWRNSLDDGDGSGTLRIHFLRTTGDFSIRKNAQRRRVRNLFKQTGCDRCPDSGG